VLANFEGCLPPPGAWPMKGKTVHPAHRTALAGLAALGVTHLSLANNHAWDFGYPGLIRTRRLAEDAGFAVAGAGRCAAEAARPALLRGVAMIAVDLGPTPDWAIAGLGPGVNPLRLRLTLGLPGPDLARLAGIATASGEAARRARRAAIGYDAAAPGPSFYGLALAEAEAPQEIWSVDEADFDRLAAGVEAARAEAGLVAVSAHYHHWAPDWRRPPDWLEPLADRILAAGADLVVCHGPPLAFGLMPRGARAIAPGLGNLAFHTRRAARYDALGLDVWRGAALLHEDGRNRLEPVAALRPEG
jgi:poly-gamma-glutamate synthesis protein (capsule biosynthesis protein)